YRALSRARRQHDRGEDPALTATAARTTSARRMTGPCPACGSATTDGDLTCPRCGQRLTAEAPLAAAVPDPTPLVGAGFGRRAVARLLDVLFTGFLGGALAALILLALGGDETVL